MNCVASVTAVRQESDYALHRGRSAYVLSFDFHHEGRAMFVEYLCRTANHFPFVSLDIDFDQPDALRIGQQTVQRGSRNPDANALLPAIFQRRDRLLHTPLSVDGIRSSPVPSWLDAATLRASTPASHVLRTSSLKTSGFASSARTRPSGPTAFRTQEHSCDARAHVHCRCIGLRQPDTVR